MVWHWRQCRFSHVAKVGILFLILPSWIAESQLSKLNDPMASNTRLVIGPSCAFPQLPSTSGIHLPSGKFEFLNMRWNISRWIFHSSAPENREYVTFHIRGVGQWTNRLYDYVEAKKKQELIDSRRSTQRSIKFNPSSKQESNNHECTKATNSNSEKKVVKYADGKDRFDLVIDKKALEQKPKRLMDNNKLVIHLDGPFGAPASNIFR